MKTAVINRQFLMGAVMNSHPSICGSIHSLIPNTEALEIGTLSELFTTELSKIANVDTSIAKQYLASNIDDVGIWLNNFCRFVLPFLVSHYIGR